MTIALTFPGQGSQAVGMGLSLAQNFPAARDVFAEVDEALGEHLSKTIWEGPEATLTLTANAQPALMAVSLAAYRALRQEYGADALKPTFLAGHSLGEYSALAAAGVFGVAQAAKLLRLRGQAMQEAVPPGEGAMLALLGAEIEQAEKLAAAAAEGDVSQVANDNAPGPSGDQRREIRHGSRDKNRAEAWRAPRGSAPRKRSLPLRAHEAGGGPHGAGAGSRSPSTRQARRLSPM